METADKFYMKRNGGKHPERALKDGELISPLWACQLMKEYAYECFKEKETEIKKELAKEQDIARDQYGFPLTTANNHIEFNKEQEPEGVTAIVDKDWIFEILDKTNAFAKQLIEDHFNRHTK